MNTRSIVVGVISLLVAPMTWAQCGAGVNTGGGNCVPPDAPGMPGYGNESGNQGAPAIRPEWIDQWGAIVIDKAAGQSGTVTNRASKREAINDATRDCASRGATQCRLSLTYHNQCAAIAWGPDGYASNGNPTEAGAQADALDLCRSFGSECKIVYSACSEAKRIR